jgi:transposase
MTQVQDELQEGPQQLFTSLAAEVDQRAGNRQVICLMDGQRSLWYRQRESLPKAIPILDLFHAMEYLWEAAYYCRRQREY